jgi:hypothetical protein
VRMRARAGAGNAAVLLSAVMPLLCSVLLCSALLSSTQPSQTQPSQLLQMGGVGTTAPAYILGTAQDKGFLTLNDHSRASDQYCRASWGWAGESSFFLSIRCGTVSIVDCRLSILSRGRSRRFIHPSHDNSARSQTKSKFSMGRL